MYMNILTKCKCKCFFYAVRESGDPEKDPQTLKLAVVGGKLAETVSTTLHDTPATSPLHCTATRALAPSTAPSYISLHFTAFHFTCLHFTSLYFTWLDFTALPCSVHRWCSIWKWVVFGSAVSWHNGTFVTGVAGRTPLGKRQVTDQAEVQLTRHTGTKTGSFWWTRLYGLRLHWQRT